MFQVDVLCVLWHTCFRRWSLRPSVTIGGKAGWIGAFSIVDFYIIEKAKATVEKTVALCWRYLSSRAVASQVLSAETSLTTVFGMGTGGPSP